MLSFLLPLFWEFALILRSSQFHFEVLLSILYHTWRQQLACRLCLGADYFSILEKLFAKLRASISVLSSLLTRAENLWKSLHPSGFDIRSRPLWGHHVFLHNSIQYLRKERFLRLNRPSLIRQVLSLGFIHVFEYSCTWFRFGLQKCQILGHAILSGSVLRIVLAHWLFDFLLHLNFRYQQNDPVALLVSFRRSRCDRADYCKILFQVCQPGIWADYYTPSLIRSVMSCCKFQDCHKQDFALWCLF